MMMCQGLLEILEERSVEEVVFLFGDSLRISKLGCQSLPSQLHENLFT